jgi:hypothetical protein
MKKPVVSILSLLAGGVAAGLLHAQNTPDERVVEVSSGFDYSRGDYGLTEDTTVWSVPATFRYEQNNWVWRANVAYLTIDGPANVVGATAGGGGGVPLGGSPGPRTQSESGLGDLSVSLTRQFGELYQGVHLDLTARVKLPTGDEDKGLGTGEVDTYVQADIYRIFENVVPFATVGYRFLGESARYPLEDGLYASAGVAFTVAAPTRVGFSVDWREQIVVGADDATEAVGFVTHRLNEQWNLIGYALKGLTDGSADFGAGGSISYRF